MTNPTTDELKAEIARLQDVQRQLCEEIELNEEEDCAKEADFLAMKSRAESAERQIVRLQGAVGLLVEAINAGQIMWHTSKPEKLDAALGWVDNDRLAQSKIECALKSAKAALATEGQKP